MTFNRFEDFRKHSRDNLGSTAVTSNQAFAMGREISHKTPKLYALLWEAHTVPRQDKGAYWAASEAD
jgi:hypothetical protein